MTHRFAADKTLGKLVKWLRILGFDTICKLEISIKLFFDSLEGTRILLTRTKKIQEKFNTHRTVFIKSNFLDEQLKQVVDEIGINQAEIRPFSRCIQCNLPIVEISKDDAYGLVPDYIWETQEIFNKCSQCERIYWRGSHTDRSMERINQLFS